MSPEATVALITVAGTLGGSILGLVGTWIIVRAERGRVRLQLELEATHRRSEKYRDELLTTLAALLAATDPEINGRPDYATAVRLINHAQLLLDPTDPRQAALNGALSRLGFAAAAHFQGPLVSGPDRDANAQALFSAQGQVTDLARPILKLPSGAA